ncbi:MAG: hypothetical protein J7621_22700 [Niastella sp.]|nr:hypothetical protein [Niastella sp.]
MAQKNDLKNDPKKEKDESALAPDPETLHKTDPQENMEGPISSLVQKGKETMEKKGGEIPDDDDEAK